MNLGTHAKLITALVTGIVGWVTLVVNSAPTAITSSEWIVGLVALVTALGVYAVPNAPSSTP